MADEDAIIASVKNSYVKDHLTAYLTLAGKAVTTTGPGLSDTISSITPITPDDTAVQTLYLSCRMAAETYNSVT